MNNQLFIPKKIKVGFQDRSDTYTKKLAYVIYYDAKGVLRKEKSWEGWRDKKIDSSEFENSPTEGFVLNKKVGGYKSDWNHRATYTRVFDPRGFEFEISIPNLLYILQETDCTRGKGLIGDFVYAWDGTDLILLPVKSETYQKCVGFSELQGKKVSARELIPGAVYETKQQEKWIYLGKYDWYEYEDYSYRSRFKNKLTKEDANYSVRTAKKQFVFATVGESFKGEPNTIFGVSGIANISQCVNDTPVDNYAELVEKFRKMEQSSKVVSIEEGLAKPIKNENYAERVTAFFKNDLDQYGYYSFQQDYKPNYSVPRTRTESTYRVKISATRIYLKDGEIWETFKTKESRYLYYRNDEKSYDQDDDSYTGTILSEEQYKNYSLPIHYAVLENGLKVPLGKLTHKDYNY